MNRKFCVLALIFSVILLGTAVILLVVLKQHDPITKEKFQEIISEYEDFEIEQVDEKTLCAYNTEKEYEIFFLVMDEADAISFVANMENRYTSKNSSKNHFRKSTTHENLYSSHNGTNMIIVSQIQSTVVYVETSSQYWKEIKAIVKKLGYR